MSVIAVFAGLHSAGREIGIKVAQRLSYNLVADDFLQRVADRFDTTIAKLNKAVSAGRGIFDSVTSEPEKSLIYLRAALAETLAADDQVIVGPLMHLIPSEITHVLRVCVVADQQFRLARAKRAGVGEKEAAKQIARGDEELASWTRQQVNASPWDADLYDIKIPLPATGIDDAVDLICQNVAKDALIPTDRSVQAALDFVLATRVNLALLDEGHHRCFVSASDGKVTVEINVPPKKGALARSIYGLRLDNLERDLRRICESIEGVQEVELRPGPGLRKPKPALLVDDEQEYVMTLSERLEMREIETDVVYDGEQALSFVEADEPEVMVLDLRMPGIDGMEVLRRVKREHPNIEVIVVTGHGSDKDERAARELGAFDYLKKPVDINVLAERIRLASNKARGETVEGDDDSQDSEE